MSSFDFSSQKFLYLFQFIRPSKEISILRETHKIDDHFSYILKIFGVFMYPIIPTILSYKIPLSVNITLLHVSIFYDYFRFQMRIALCAAFANNFQLNKLRNFILCIFCVRSLLFQCWFIQVCILYLFICKTRFSSFCVLVFLVFVPFTIHFFVLCFDFDVIPKNLINFFNQLSTS